MQSVLESLSDGLTILNYSDWLIFVERLSEAVRRGQVRKVPVLKQVFSRDEEWFLDPASGDVYAYQPPNPPVYPKWQKIDVLTELERPEPSPLSTYKTGEISVMAAHVMKLNLEALISRGLVEELPPPPATASSKDTSERWFRDRVSDFVYRLSEHYPLKGADDIRWELVPKDEVNRRVQ